MEIITIEGALPTAMRLGIDDSTAATNLLRLTKGQRGGWEFWDPHSYVPVPPKLAPVIGYQ
eukprot:661934-Prymnesium_polylepis.1